MFLSKEFLIEHEFLLSDEEYEETIKYYSSEAKDDFEEFEDDFKEEEWFHQNFSNGGDYQEILDNLAQKNWLNVAKKLLDAAGKTDDIFTNNGERDLYRQNSFFFAGSVNMVVGHGGSFTVLQDVLIGGNLTADEINVKNITVYGNIHTDSKLTVNDKLYCLGSVRVVKDIFVQNYAEIGGDFESIKSNIDICGNLKVSGNIECKCLSVSKNINVDGFVKTMYWIECNSINSNDHIMASYIHASGNIHAKRFVSCTQGIKTWGSIISDTDLIYSVSGSIVAGRIIRAKKISCNDNYGIYAGMQLKLDNYSVFADSCPDNLVCGKFQQVTNSKDPS